MKALLALFVALFALTAAVPASAVHGRCAMAGQTMDGMDMSARKTDSSDPCCDLAHKSCALACDAVCAASLAVPANIAAAVPGLPMIAVLATPSQGRLSSYTLALTDPPPKPHLDA